MNAASSELTRAGRSSESRRPAPAALRTRVYLAAVAAATAALAAPLLARLDLQTHGWPTFLILAACAGIAQLFVVRTARHALHTAIVFLIAAALLLPPELVALMGLVQHVPEWLKQRQAWHVQSFNICNYTLNGLAAWWVASILTRDAGLLDVRSRWALAGLAACIVFVGLNRALLATMLYLDRGQQPRETGLFTWGNLSTELVLAALGIGLAGLWKANPWLVPFAVAPLLLIHRSLHVPRLEEQARIDSKTGLFNARHFSTALNDELSRGARFGRPVSLIMADLDLLREINNTYGHLAGDAVLAGVAKVFRTELRHYDIPVRFGGEEFAILLPETSQEDALEIAERVRRAVASRPFDVETSSEPLRATISMGVATFPRDAKDPNELVHHADRAVYRAKLQGRNRVLAASNEPLVLRGPGTEPVIPLNDRLAVAELLLSEETARRKSAPARDRRRPTGRAASRPRFPVGRARLVVFASVVAFVGIAAGAGGLIAGSSDDVLGMLALTLLIVVGQSLAREIDNASISVGAVGALTGAALFGARPALLIAGAMVVVDWSERRPPLHQLLVDLGTLSLATTAAVGVFALGPQSLGGAVTIVTALGAGLVYYVTNVGVLSLGLAVERDEGWFRLWRERFSWLAPHYLGYGLIAGVMAIAYHAAGLYALAVAVVPLVLMRNTQAAYLAHAQRGAQKLREAAEAIERENAMLEKANHLLRNRSTAVIESLSATVDARDPHAAGHSRRVQRLALAIGRELGLSRGELDVLGHAALVHDIGKVSIPDAILLKPARLDSEEWGLMRRHSDEGARMIDRLGFLEDAVPAIRHHHECYDGTGYPDHLRGEEIPLGARIIHVADALDSMLTARVYRAALAAPEALAELQRLSGKQFCPRCVAAAGRILPPEVVECAPAPLELLTA